MDNEQQCADQDPVPCTRTPTHPYHTTPLYLQGWAHGLSLTEFDQHTKNNATAITDLKELTAKYDKVRGWRGIGDAREGSYTCSFFGG